MLREISKTWPLTLNPWIDYLDDEGWHKCQPDGVLETDAGVFVLEVKLRQNWQAYEELELLYWPVVEHYWGDVAGGLVVCNSLQSKVQGWLFTGPNADIRQLPRGQIGTWFFRA